jgi:transcription initiation factor TFIIIB Brf1 subunit/transcription initiation factor TFIIB
MLSPGGFVPALSTCCKSETYYKEGRAICIECGLCGEQTPFEVGNEAWGRYNFRKKRRHTGYKRITRFREVIKSLQGVGEATIPDDLVPYLKKRISQYPTSHFFDHHWVRKQLKREKKFENLLESSVRIARIIFPEYKAPLGDLPQELIESFFQDISASFDKVRATLSADYALKRVTFLQYGFVLQKILELVGRWKDAKTVGKEIKLKTHHLCSVQEFVWAEICKDLKFEFVPDSASWFRSPLAPALHPKSLICQRKKERTGKAMVRRPRKKSRPLPKVRKQEAGEKIKRKKKRKRN